MSGYPLEAKHTGGREPVEVVIARYQPQLQWTMFVTGAREAALTIILGAREPIVEFVDRDDAYIAEMLKRAKQFMFFVRARISPVELPPAPPPVSALREIDMSGDDVWRHNALEWFQVRGAAETAKNCEKVLKGLVPADARKAFGHGVRITRDRAGRLSLRVDEEVAT